MNDETANSLNTLLSDYVIANQFAGATTRLPNAATDAIDNFHEWVNGRPLLGAHLLPTINNGSLLWLLLIKWQNEHNPNNPHGWYLVVFPEDQRNPLMEIHRVDGNNRLCWSYVPRLHHGNNHDRQVEFARILGIADANVQIEIPNVNTVDFFLERINQIILAREQAHRLG
jgi:hypothetical protein